MGNHIEAVHEKSSLKMKGKEALLEFLESGKPLSEAKEALPCTTCDREALLEVCFELHSKVPKNATLPTELNVEAQEFRPENNQTVSPPVKPEKEKLCKSMWGKVVCPGETCVRIHLKWCSNPPCFINEERNKDCPLWHGHKWVAAAKAKKSQREARKKELGERHQTQGNSAKGRRGAPHRKQPQQQGPRVIGKPRPHRFTLAPAPAVSVWDNPRIAPTSAQAVSMPDPRFAPSSTPVVQMPGIASHGTDPRLQMQQLLQMQLALLQSIRY